MTSKEIIEKICRDNNLTFRMLAQITGLPEQYLYDINGGKIKKITAQKSSKITKQFPNYSPMWLMTGEGEILVSSPKNEPSIPGTEINIDNTNMGHHNNIGHHNSVNISGIPAGGDAETWKKIAESHEQQIADLKQQIADLKADKEKLYQLLMKK